MVKKTGKKVNTRKRGNGNGSVYKRKQSYQLEIVVGWNDNGRPIRKTKSGFKTKKEAYDYAPILRAEYASSVASQEPENEIIKRQAERNNFTFAELYERFIEQHERRVGKSTINCYNAAYKHFEPIHSRRFRDLDGEDIQICIDDCPLKTQTKKNMKMVASKLCQYAKSLKIVDINFAEAVYIDVIDSEGCIPFPNDVLDKLMEAADNGVPYADYIVCACYLGFRPTAFLGLKLEDYNPEKNYITGGIKTEAGRNREVPVSPKIQHLINVRIEAGNEYLFPRADGKKMDSKFFREHCFYPTLAALKIQPEYEPGKSLKYKPYSCRHTFATFMKNAQGSDKDKSALMGHTSYSMTLKYQHEDLESKRRIIDQL